MDVAELAHLDCGYPNFIAVAIKAVTIAFLAHLIGLLRASRLLVHMS